jgi:GntR family transcriptional regulator
MAQKHDRPQGLQTKLDRSSPIPLYVQLKNALEAQIESAHWKPGDRIPGEAELCRIFNVSRAVVRQALKEMTYEGLITRQKGRGSFVAGRKISARGLLQSLEGFYQDMARQGLAPLNKVLEQEIQPASDKIARYLRLEPLEPVIKIKRLRFVQDEPIVLVTSYLPYQICRKLIKADLTQRSLYEFLEQECGLTIARGRRRIDAVVADEYEAELLQVEKGAPLIRLESVSYGLDGRPLEYFYGLFRADRSRFEVEIMRVTSSGKLAEALGTDEEEWLT